MDSNKEQKMKNPEVSVVVPVYNGERTLKQCLDSLFKQTFRDYEVIIVNNNSTDNTASILSSYKENSPLPFKVVFEGYRGRGTARNAGINIAKGKIILSSDADCIFPKEWIKEITEPIRKGREVAVLGGEEPAIDNFWARKYQEYSNRFRKANIIGNNYINHIDTKHFAILRKVLMKFKTKEGVFHKSLYTDDFEFATRFLAKGYRIKLLQKCKVKHHHYDSFFRTLRLDLWRAYDSTKVYLKLKKNNSFVPNTTVLNSCLALDKRDLISFFKPVASSFSGFIYILYSSISKEVSKKSKKKLLRRIFAATYSAIMDFIYVFTSVTCWRAGVIWAFIDGKKLEP